MEVKNQLPMWVKTGYLTDFINSGGVTLPPDVKKFVKEIQVIIPETPPEKWNKCPFCDNYHKKYTLFRSHPANLNGNAIEYYVCKDCRNVIEREDPILLEGCEPQIRDWNELPPDHEIDDSYESKSFKGSGKTKKLIDQEINDDILSSITSIYLKEFALHNKIPEHVLDYSFANLDKCIWCESTQRLIEEPLPFGTFGVIMRDSKMCKSCLENYLDIIDRYHIGTNYVTSECVQCKHIYYISKEEAGNRILSNTSNAHYCTKCLVENGLENHPIKTKINCIGCSTTLVDEYDLSLGGKFPKAQYCMKCSEELSHSEHEEYENRKVSPTLFPDNPPSNSDTKLKYYRKLISAEYSLYVTVVFWNDTLYFRIEECLDEEENIHLNAAIELTDEDSPEYEELTDGMTKEEYGWTKIIYSSYKSNYTYTLTKNPTEDFKLIHKCISDAIEMAEMILSKYNKTKMPL